MNQTEIDKLIAILYFMNMRIASTELDGNNDYSHCHDMIDDLITSIEIRTTLC